MPDSTKRYIIQVSGKVQGVFFRASTKEMADRLLVKGFVRNEKDGSVYIEAEGTNENMEAFIRWCHEGPTHARVESCHVRAIAPQGDSAFIISR